MTTEDTTTDEATEDQAPAETEDQAPAEDGDTTTDTAETDTAETDAGEDGDDSAEDDRDSFPRSYVKRLRERSAGYRARAKSAEQRTAELEQALFTERVRALDVLADPADLPFDADLLDDPDALADAVHALVKDRPHYRRRGTTDSTTTGARDRNSNAGTVSLTGIMRGHS